MKERLGASLADIRIVPNCCEKSGTSFYHLITRLLTVTSLLQVVPARQKQAVRNMSLLSSTC
jgi:hypothetical protein